MISIIIPVYNRSKELDKCLGSIEKQSYENYEVVVVNDRSTQRFSWVMEKWKERMGLKIDFYHCMVNHGAPYARNKGYSYTKGEYVLFCDSDAVLTPDALKIMHDELRNHPEASYVYPSHYWGRKLFKLWPFDAEKLKKMPYIHTMALMRREHFPKNGWDANIRKLNDWDFWLSVLEEGHIGHWIDKPLFRIKPGGIYSDWVPSAFYKLFPFLPAVKRYNKAILNVKTKHNLI